MYLPKIVQVDDPVVSPIRKTNPREFKLEHDMLILTGGPDHIVIPEGFITDFASTPTLLWAIMPPDGWLLYGSIPHDFGYRYGYFLDYYYPEKEYSKEQLALRESFPDSLKPHFIPVYIGCGKEFIDELFDHVNVAAEDAVITSKLGEAGVAVGGWATWNKLRTQGPNAYKMNTLRLPGLNEEGDILHV